MAWDTAAWAGSTTATPRDSWSRVRYLAIPAQPNTNVSAPLSFINFFPTSSKRPKVSVSLLSPVTPMPIAISPANLCSNPKDLIYRIWRGIDLSNIAIIPNLFPKDKADRIPLSAIPNTGFLVNSRVLFIPGSEKQAITKASAKVSFSLTISKTCIATVSACSWDSIPGGPYGLVMLVIADSYTHLTLPTNREV